MEKRIDIVGMGIIINRGNKTILMSVSPDDMFIHLEGGK